MKILAIGAGLISANFLYLAIFGGTLETAIDRSFFQAIAIAVTWSMFLRDRVRQPDPPTKGA